ncbi:MAG: CHAT domain-containing protein [Methylococcaceae bacterium]
MPFVTAILADLAQRLNVFLLGLLVITLSACAFAPVSPALTSMTGDGLFDRGDIPAALLAWQQVQPNNDLERFELSLRQSRAYRELGNAKAALQSAETTLNLATKLGQAHAQQLASIELGLARIASLQLDKACQTLLAVQAQLNKQTAHAELAQIESGLALLNKLNAKPDAALAHYQTAQNLAEQAHNALLAANIAVLRTQITAETQNKTATQVLWEQAVQKVHSLPVSNRSVFALIHLARIAQTANLFNDGKLAMELLQEAQHASETLNDARLLSYALGYQAYWHELQQHWQQAQQLTAQAADAAQRANALESLYLWEWQAARLHVAQQQQAAGLAAYRRAVFDLQQVRQDLASSQSFREQISPLFLGLADLLLKKAAVTSNTEDKQALLQEARATVEKLKTAELQDYFQDRCVANFKEKSQGLEQVAPKTAVLYPILLPDRLEMLVSFEQGLQQVTVPVSSKELNANIRDFRYKLEKRTTFQYLRPAQQLHRWLIEPLLSSLRAKQVETLVIVPDGALRTIPFAALHDGKQYLIEQFALATTPSLALTNPQALPTGHIDVLLNGLTQSVQGFVALPYVQQELDAIQSQFTDSHILENQAFQGDALGEALATNPYRIVHIASHGQFSRNPKETFLLTYDGRLTMDALEHYLSASKYRDQPVELLTLSACQTATGDDRAALGMAGVAVKAGARSALASLWFINDEASSDLIEQFYSHLKQHDSKAQALRGAQVTLLKDARYRHASYWSPFLLIGNWL